MTELNLSDALYAEIERCKELLESYKSIPTGAFGAMMIEDAIRRAVEAQKNQDVVAIARSYKELLGCQ